MSSAEDSKINEKSPTDESSPNITDSDADTAHPQPHPHANAQQEPAFTPLEAPPLPRLLLLTDLKDQSALIQCPHCLRYVYTKLSHRGDYWEFIAFYIVIRGFLSDMISFNWAVILVVALFILNCLAYTVHDCPSCNKKVATFNKFEKVINITAPAIAIPRSAYS
ncbi:unnamed protein product [Mucor fragilis]